MLCYSCLDDSRQELKSCIRDMKVAADGVLLAMVGGSALVWRNISGSQVNDVTADTISGLAGKKLAVRLHSFRAL